MVDGYGLAGLPDISEDDWNTYTADQFSRSVQPFQDALAFQQNALGSFDSIMAAQAEEDERRRQQEMLLQQQRIQFQAQQERQRAQAQPYDDLRSMMEAPTTPNLQVGNGMPPMGQPPPMGPPGPPQPGFWEGTDPSKPNVFSWAGQGLQQGADELRRSGFTQTPVIGPVVGGLAQAGANALTNLGGTSQALRRGDVLGAAGGVLQATVGENTPLGWGKDILTEGQAPTQILPFIDPETPVLGGLNNPRELAGLAPQLILPETSLERAVGRGVIEPAGRAALGAARTGYEGIQRAVLGEGPEAALAMGIRAGERPETQGRFLHGSGYVFDRYDPEKLDPNALFGPGVYGTKDPRLADSYTSSTKAQTPMTVAEARPSMGVWLDPTFLGNTPEEDRLGNLLIKTAWPFGLPDLDTRSADLAIDYLGDLHRELDDLAHPYNQYGFRDSHNPEIAKALGLTADEVKRGVQNVTRRIQFVRTTEGPQANVRPFDVAPDLRLLDIDNPLPPEELGLLEQRLRSQPGGAFTWDQMRREIVGEATQRQLNQRGYDESAKNAAHIKDLIGNDVYRGVENFYNGDRAQTNRFLSRAGYDGVTHIGGLRSPLPDASGNPITHQVSVIFPEKLDRITNSLSGVRGGMIGQGGTYYHGSPYSFTDVDPSKFHDTTDRGPGYYMSNNPEIARWFMRDRNYQGTAVPEGASMRKIEVPPGLKFLDLRKKENPATGFLEAERITDDEALAVAEVLNRYHPDAGQAFLDSAYTPIQGYSKAADLTAENIDSHIARAFSKVSGNDFRKEWDIRQGKHWNDFLSEAGWSGKVFHERTPLPDPEGVTFDMDFPANESLVIFNDRLGEVRNAISGTPRGMAEQIPLDQPLPGSPRVTNNGQWPPEWGPQPTTQRQMPPVSEYDARNVPYTLFNRAATEFGGGAALGGVAGIAATQDEPDPVERGKKIGALMLGGGLGTMGLLHGANLLGISLVEKLWREGRISEDYLRSHPTDLNRIKAVMRAQANSVAGDDDLVPVPAIMTALGKIEGGFGPAERELLSGNLTKREVLARIGAGDPTRDSHSITQWMIDLLRAQNMGERRMEEFGADVNALGSFAGAGVENTQRFSDIARGIAQAMGLPPDAFDPTFVGGFRTAKPDVAVQAFSRQDYAAGRKPVLAYNQAFHDLYPKLTQDERIALAAHEMAHLKAELDRNARGQFYRHYAPAGGGGVRMGMAEGGAPELPEDLTPEENPLPSAETAGDVISRVLSELTPEGRARIQEVGQLGAGRAPWLGEALARSEEPVPSGSSRYEDIMRIANPDAQPISGEVADALDEADAAGAGPPPHKFDKAERERLGNPRLLGNQPEPMRQMADQANAALTEELMRAHGFKSEAEAAAAAERVAPYMLQFARGAKPNEPVNQVLLDAGRKAYAQSIFPAYFAEIDRWKMLNSPEFGQMTPEQRAAYQQASDYWAAARQVLGVYAGEIAPSEAGRTFRSMRHLPEPVIPAVGGGSPEAAEAAAPGINRAVKTPKERAYEDMMRHFRTARRGQTQVETAGEQAARRGTARVSGKKPNGPLANMGIEWADVLRRTGNDDADRMKMLAGLEELGGYRMRRDWLDRAMKLDLSDGKAVDDFWKAAREYAGVDEQLRPFVKFDPNVSGQSYLGAADTITKEQALSLVSKELIKDADEAHAAAREARSSGAPAREVETMTRRAEEAFKRLGLRIENWNPDNMAILARAGESVRDRIAKEWPADRPKGSGAAEQVEKKRQLLGVFDQEIKKEQRLAGVPVTGLQDLLSFGTSNVLMTGRFVQASILESALSAINEPLQSFLRGNYGQAGAQLRGLGRAFGLPSGEDLAALGEGIKAPAMVNALRGLKDIGPMEAAGEMRTVAREGAGAIRSDSPNWWSKIVSPMHRVSRGISEAFQTGNYFAEVSRLAREAERTGLLPGGRRINRIVDDATGQTRNPTARELFGNLPQEIVDEALKKSRFVNEGGAPDFLEKQIGQWKGLLNKPNATGTERAQGLFANLMFPFVYGLRPAIRSGFSVGTSIVKHPYDIAQALRRGDTEEAKYAAKKLVLAQTFNGFIAYNVLAGNITGHGPTDPSTRQALMEQTDENGDPIWRPDSYRIPNPGGGHTWVKYASLPGPVSIVSTVMANMYEAYAYDGKDMETPTEQAARMASRIAPSYFDNTYFRDMINLAEAFNQNSGPEGFARMAGQVAGRFVPGAGALRTAAITTDPYNRITSNIGEDILSGIPGARQQLPAQVSAYTGRPVEQPMSPLTALGGLAGNVYASPSEPNPMARETADLARRRTFMDATPEVPAGVRPSEGVEGMFPQTFTRCEQSRGAEFAGGRQSGEGIRGAQAAFGVRAETDLLSLINSPQYQALPPQQQAERISQVVERSSANARYAAEGAPGLNIGPEQRLRRENLQSPQFRGISGSPDEIAEQNQRVRLARETLSQLTSRYGRARAMAILRDADPEALRLARAYRPMNRDLLWIQEQERKARLGLADEDGTFLIPDFGRGPVEANTAGLTNRLNRPPSRR